MESHTINVVNKKEQKRKPGRHYFFKNSIVSIQDEFFEVTTAGKVYQRDGNGSLRNIPTIWLSRIHWLQIESLSGKTGFIGVRDGKIVGEFRPKELDEKTIDTVK